MTKKEVLLIMMDSDGDCDGVACKSCDFNEFNELYKGRRCSISETIYSKEDAEKMYKEMFAEVEQ